MDIALTQRDDQNNTVADTPAFGNDQHFKVQVTSYNGRTLFLHTFF